MQLLTSTQTVETSSSPFVPSLKSAARQGALKNDVYAQVYAGLRTNIDAIKMIKINWNFFTA